MEEVVRNVQRITLLEESSPAITSMSEEFVFLATLQKKLVEVSFPQLSFSSTKTNFIATLPLRSARRTTHLNEQRQSGDDVIKPPEDGDTPFDYWSYYADACDIDIIKLAFSQVYAYEMHVHEMHAYEIYVCKVQLACECV